LIGYIIYIIGCVLIISVLLKIYRSAYLHPVVISTIYWAFIVFISLSGSQLFDLNYYWSGLFPISLILISFCLGSAVAERHSTKIDLYTDTKRNHYISIFNTFNSSALIILLLSLAGFVSSIILLSYYTLSIKSFKDLAVAVDNLIREH
jgi:hypothetical protein